MPEVFISYAEADRPLAERLGESLPLIGYSTWYYHRDYIPGILHLETTKKQIEAASVFLVIISPASLESDFVFPELLHAVAVRKHLVPVLAKIRYNELEHLKPRWITALGFAVAVEWTGEPAAFAALLRGLVALLGEKQQPLLASAAERYEVPPFKAVALRVEMSGGKEVQEIPRTPAFSVPDALKHLRDHTKFLWEELCRLQSYRTEGETDIKQVTMDKVRPALNVLVEAGHLRYQTEDAYRTVTSGEQVLKIRIYDVTVQLMNMAKSMNNRCGTQADPSAAPEPARDVGLGDS